MYIQGPKLIFALLSNGHNLFSIIVDGLSHITYATYTQQFNLFVSSLFSA